MKPLKIVLGFLPFVAFSVLAHFLDVGWAAAVGLLAAAVGTAVTARGGVKIPPAVQGAILLVMTVLAVTGGRGVDAFLTHYGPGLAGVLFGFFLVATAAVMPFTAQISRETVPPEYWHSPRFLEVNRRISTAWGLAVLVLGLCQVAGAEIGDSGPALALRLAVNWVVPIVVLWQARNYSNRTAAAARQAVAHHAGAETQERTHS